MKKLILSIAIILAGFSMSFANRLDDIKDRAIASFHKEFYQATEMSWAQSNNFVQVTFSINKQIMYAYYDFQGNLIGLVHHILTTSLPENLQKDIKKNYGGYWVSELFEVTNEEGTHFVIQLRNADETLVLHSEGKVSWHTYATYKNKSTDL